MKLSVSGFFKTPTQEVAVEPRTPQPAFPLHDHDFDETVVVLSGSGWHEINTSQEIVSVGDVLYIRSADRHKFHSVHNLCLVNVLYRPGLLGGADEGIAAEIATQRDASSGIAQWQISEAGLAATRPILEALRQECAGGKAFARPMAASLFLQLNITLLRHRTLSELPQGAPSAPRELGASAVHFMRQHYAGIVRTDEVARAFGISASNFNRKFRTTVGMSPHGFLTRLRITHAMRELKITHDSITDIALRCGFNDSNYFSSCFTNFAGISPSRYRHIAL